jgi:hypothetical protein
MVARLEFALETKGVRDAIKRAPREIFTELRRAFRDDAVEWDALMQRRTSGGGVRRRTGRTAASIGWVVTGNVIDDLEMRAFSSGTQNARLLEFGGIVRPRRTKYLTIPVDDNIRPGSGTVRYPSARALFAREPKNVFVLRLKSGGLYIVRRTKDDLQFLFKLVKKSVMPGPRGPYPAPRPGGSYLGFFYEWRSRADQRASRHRRAVARALESATKQGGNRG